MSYQVIARKWRPQAFEEVTGQEQITRTLRNAIEHERLHHAYLFSGARGVGKTTTARLLAKAVNCHRSSGPTPTPCKSGDPDACASCVEIADGRSIDVLEIDAASNTGVDNVRDAIINTVGVRPARDRYKVFIIDEVHMLSGAAFNALLKTLEEPPSRVLFIMATTESHKVPDTILSRCQQFEFRTIATAKIAERLRLIADAEKIDVSDEALREIARVGEGSMRDAQSAFDQVISFSEGRIGNEEVESALGLAGSERLARVMNAIAEGQPAAALEVIDDLVMRGHDLRNFCRDLMGHLRDLLVAKVTGDGAGLSDATEAERRALLEQAKEFSESDLVRFFHSLTETEQNLREGAHPRYQVEIGVVKLVDMRRLAPLTQILDRLNALEETLRANTAPPSGPMTPSDPPSGAPSGGSGSGRSGGPSGSRGAAGGRSAAPVQAVGNPVAGSVAGAAAVAVKPASSVAFPDRLATALTQPTRPSAPSVPFSVEEEPEWMRDAPTEFPSFQDRVGAPIALEIGGTSLEPEGTRDEILDRLKRELESRKRALVVASLEVATRVSIANGALLVQFSASEKSHFGRLSGAENKAVLAEICRELTGQATEVRIELSLENRDIQDEDESQVEQRRLREAAVNSPIVQQVQKIFRAEIVDVRQD